MGRGFIHAVHRPRQVWCRVEGDAVFCVFVKGKKAVGWAIGSKLHPHSEHRPRRALCQHGVAVLDLCQGGSGCSADRQQALPDVHMQSVVCATSQRAHQGVPACTTLAGPTLQGGQARPVLHVEHPRGRGRPRPLVLDALLSCLPQQGGSCRASRGRTSVKLHLVCCYALSPSQPWSPVTKLSSLPHVLRLLPLRNAQGNKDGGTGSGGAGSADVAAKLDAMQRQLDKLEALLQATLAQKGLASVQ